MRLLLLGASGLVGSRTLSLALSSSAFSAVIAPTRKPLTPHDRLVNPVASRLEELTSILMSHPADAVICALGTTQAKAGSKEAFRQVDYELPIAFGKAAHAAGIGIFALVSAMGASDQSMSFYYRIKGEVEKAVQQIGFRSLTICRPSLIGGARHETRRAEGLAIALLTLLAPIVPKKFHVNPAERISDALLRAVMEAKPGCRWILAQEMH